MYVLFIIIHIYLGPQILQFYETYFNTSFPLPKQDMIAVPGKNWLFSLSIFDLFIYLLIGKS